MAPHSALPLLLCATILSACRALDGSEATQRTLALIKPDAYDKAPSILVDIADLGFSFVEVTELQLSPATVGQFYEEHRQRPFFDDLVRFMSSGRTVAAVLQKRDAVNSWRSVLGPTDSDVAREMAPDSLRAKYGLDKTRNALHGSDSESSAIREIGFFFPRLKAKTEATNVHQENEATLKGNTGSREEQTIDVDVEEAVAARLPGELMDGGIENEATWKGMPQDEVVRTIAKIAQEKGESIEDVVKRINDVQRQGNQAHTEL